MSGTADDPVARLKAGLDADHWQAFKFHRDSQWSAEMLAGLFGLDESDPVVHYVARHDPARTLRRVAADRAFLALVEHYLADDPSAAPWDGESQDLMDAAIRARLAIYSDDDA